MRLAGAVLTGGASRRMGSDKALLEVGGSAMAARVAAALEAGGCRPVFAVGGDLDELRALGLDAVPDRHPGEGPLGGIITALAHLADVDDAVTSDGTSDGTSNGTTHGALDGVVVIACDLPRVEASVVAAVASALGDHDVAAACDEGPRPLCAAWSRSVLPALEARFDAGERAVRRATAGLDLVEVPVDGTRLRNVNTPDDLVSVRLDVQSSG